MNDPLIYHIKQLPDVLVYMMHKRLENRKKQKNLDDMRSDVERFFGTFIKVPCDLEYLIRGNR